MDENNNIGRSIDLLKGSIFIREEKINKFSSKKKGGFSVGVGLALKFQRFGWKIMAEPECCMFNVLTWMPELNHAISQDICSKFDANFRKSVCICVNSSCVHVNLYVHVMVFGLFECTCHVWKRRESNREKIECIVCSLCMLRHEISFDERMVMATRSIASRSLFRFTCIRERSLFSLSLFLGAFVCRSASLAAFY